MSYDRPSFYLTFGGILFPLASGNEQWQTGVKFTTAPSFDIDDYKFALTNISIADILEDCTQLIQGQKGTGLGWPNVTTVSWAKLAILDTEGRYATDPILAEQAPVGGSFGAFPYPVQLAAVVSLWSGETFGRANRGRSYLPPPDQWWKSYTVNDPRPTAALSNSIRDHYKTWLHDVAGEVSTVPMPVFPAIMSKLGAGTTKPVAHIGVGRVIDTMRSRRQALDEATVFSPY